MIENTEVQYQGLILDDNTVSEEDYIFWADKFDIPENTNKEKHFYNQATLTRTRNACALYGCAWAVSDLTWYKFTQKELLEITLLAEKEFWWKENIGMYMYKAVDCLRKYWNLNFPDTKLESYRISIGDKNFIEALQKNHSLVIGYRTSKEYYNDTQSDWVVNGEDFPKNGGHLVRTNFNTAVKIDDNYFETKPYNTYTNEKLVKLKDNWVFFPSAYIFIKEKTMDEVIKSNIDLSGAKDMFDKWYWNGLNPRQPMSRQEVMVVLKRILDK